jgi:hypothetical protein
MDINVETLPGKSTGRRSRYRPFLEAATKLKDGQCIRLDECKQQYTGSRCASFNRTCKGLHIAAKVVTRTVDGKRYLFAIPWNWNNGHGK